MNHTRVVVFVICVVLATATGCELPSQTGFHLRNSYATAEFTVACSIAGSPYNTIYEGLEIEPATTVELHEITELSELGELSVRILAEANQQISFFIGVVYSGEYLAVEYLYDAEAGGPVIRNTESGLQLLPSVEPARVEFWNQRTSVIENGVRLGEALHIGDIMPDERTESYETLPGVRYLQTLQSSGEWQNVGTVSNPYLIWADDDYVVRWYGSYYISVDEL